MIELGVTMILGVAFFTAAFLTDSFFAKKIVDDHFDSMEADALFCQQIWMNSDPLDTFYRLIDMAYPEQNNRNGFVVNMIYYYNLGFGSSNLYEFNYIKL